MGPSDYGLNRAKTNCSQWEQESRPCTSPGQQDRVGPGSGGIAGEPASRLMGWPSLIPLRSRSRVLNWPAPTSTPSMMNFWSAWWPVLPIQNYRISMTQGSTRYLRGVPVRFQYWQRSRSQRPCTRPTSHHNEHLQAKKCGQKGVLWDTLWHTTASTARFFFFSLEDCLTFKCKESIRLPRTSFYLTS